MGQELLELSETPLFDEIPEISTQCGSSDVTKNVPEENVDYETSELSETHLKEVDVEPTVPLCGALLNKSLDNRRKLLNDKAHDNTEISAQSQLKDLDSLHNENRNPDDVMEHEPSEILETTSLKDESSLTDNMPTLSLDNSSQMERFNNGPIPKEIVDHTSTEISGTTPLSDVDSLSNEKKDLSLDVSSQKESVEYKTTIPDEIVLKSGISSDKLAQMETVDVDNTSSIVDVEDELVEIPDSTDLMEADPLCNDSITIQNELMEQETTEMQSTINLQETVFPSSKKIISTNDST
ncbi:hypothetical protein C0J52_26265 [Blattella germanica]|nr:hypothetical protein C0J52_26265 [Blattella germanica]